MRGRRVVHLPPLAQPRVGHHRAERERRPSTSCTSRRRTAVTRAALPRGRGPASSAGQVQVGLAVASSVVEVRAASAAARRRRADEGADVGGRAGLAGAVEEVGHPREGGPADGGVVGRRRGRARATRAPTSGRDRGGGGDVPRQRPVLGQRVQGGAGPVGARQRGRDRRRARRPPRRRSPAGRGRRPPSGPVGPSSRNRVLAAMASRSWRLGTSKRAPWPRVHGPSRRHLLGAGQRAGVDAGARRSAAAPPAGWRCGRAGRGARRSPARRRTAPPRPAPARRRRRTRPRPRRPPSASDSAMRPGERGSTSASVAVDAHRGAVELDGADPPVAVQAVAGGGPGRARTAPWCRCAPPPRGRPRRRARGRRTRAARRRRSAPAPASPPPGCCRPAPGARRPRGRARASDPRRRSTSRATRSDRPPPPARRDRPRPARTSRGCPPWSSDRLVAA